MASLSVKQQISAEKSKDVLTKVLAREENKLCADCHAKGPRWSSWNIGVVLCIRCSGIHRSLGVHISKVKSINLDTWTLDQLISLCSRGNDWAREKYEARLDPNFKRPQTDTATEHFIRDKYDRLKYATNDNIPLRSIDEYDLVGSKISKPKPAQTNGSAVRKNVESAVPRPLTNQAPVATARPQPAPVRPISNGTVTANLTVDNLLDLSTVSSNPTPAPADAPTMAFNAVNEDKRPSKDLTFDLFTSMQSNYSQNTAPPPATNQVPAAQPPDHPQPMSKDTIMSLYNMTSSTAMVANPFASAGPYNMAQQQPMMMYQQAPPVASNIGFSTTGFPQQVGLQQAMPGYPAQQPIMQTVQQPNMQQTPWQQQQMQMQMQNMNIGSTYSLPSQGSMRSFHSMPQMSAQQAAFGGMQNIAPSPGMLIASQQSGLAASQPAMRNSWGNTGGQQIPNGQTLNSTLWK